MDIFIDDLIFSLQQAGGISVYWSELMKRMNRSQHNITCIQNKHTNNILASTIHWQKQSMNDVSLPLSIKRFLPLPKRLPAKSIFHSSYLRWSKQQDIANIVTIHDLAPETGLIKGKGKFIRQWQQRKALQHADGIICVSETIKQDLLNHYSFLKEGKIKAIHHGVSELFYPLPKEEQQQPYVLFVGHRSGYKNFNLAVEVVAAIPEMKLIVVGGKQLTIEEQSLLEKKLNNRYEFKAVVKVDELNRLYNNAFCLLYPSSYEGFGLPIAEAMKVGCPVVTTKCAAIPEVAGNGALLVDGFTIDGFVHAIQSLHESHVRSELVEKGKQQAKKFSWETCFNETVAFYQDIYRKKFNS